MKRLVHYSRQMLPIAVPVMLQSLVEYLFVFTDTAFIGHYDQAGLSAINNVMTPFFAVLSFFFALTQGVTILVSQIIGANRRAEARRYAETSFFALFWVSLALGVMWIFAARPVLELMGARGAILEMGTTYLQILSVQFFTFGLGITAGSVFQALGRTFPVMVTVILKSALNVLLNWVLIFGLFGFPELGIAGSALGTVISNCLLDLGLFALLLWGKTAREFRLKLRGIFMPRWRYFGQVLRMGLPVGGEFILWNLGQVVIIAFINRLDSVSSGYFGVLSILIILSIQIYNGIGVATLVLIGQATGGERHSEVLPISNAGLTLSFVACGVVSFLFLVIPDALLSLFLPDPAVRHELVPLLQFSALILFCKALNILAGNSIRGTGNTLWMLYTQIAGTVVIIAAAALFLFGWHWGLAGLLAAVLIDELGRGIVNEVKFLASRRRFLPGRA